MSRYCPWPGVWSFSETAWMSDARMDSNRGGMPAGVHTSSRWSTWWSISAAARPARMTAVRSAASSIVRSLRAIVANVIAWYEVVTPAARARRS